MTEPAEAPRQHRRRVRWWRAVAAGVVVCLVASVAIAHLPFVRSRVLSWATARLEQQGIHLEAAGLDYNLLGLRATLRQVAVSAVTHPDAPFFEADLVRVDLPWAILRGGGIQIQSLEIMRPRLTVVRDATGAFNLPTFETGDEGGSDSPIQIGHLRIDDLTVRYEDAMRAHRAVSADIRLDMQGLLGERIDGQLTTTGTTTLEIGDIATSMTALDGDLSFDGRTLTVRRLVLETPEISARAEGTVGVRGDDPALDLRYDAQVDAAGVAPWLDLSPAPTGHLALAGRVHGPLGAPTVETTVTSTDLVWPEVGPVTIDARGSFAGSTVTIDTAHLTAAGGELTAEGRVQLDDAPSDVRASWRNLNLYRVSGLVAPDGPVRIASVADGTLSATWTGRDVTAARADLSATLRTLSASTGALPLAGPIDLRFDNRLWRMSTRQQVAHTIAIDADLNGRLADAPEALSASTLAGRASIAIDDLSAAVGQLQAAGFAQEAGDAERLQGAVASTVSLSGTFADPRAIGTVTGHDVSIYETGPATLTTRIDATSKLVALDDVRIEINGNTIDGHLRVGIADNTIGGTLTGAFPQVVRLAGALPAEWRPEGSATLTATIAGALDNPTVDAVASSVDLRVAGQTLHSIQADLRLADRVVTVERLDLAQDEGRLSVTGRYHLDGGAYAFTASGKDLVVTPIVRTPVPEGGGGEPQTDTIPITARFDLQLEGEGTRDAPQAAGQIQVAQLAWGDYEIGTAVADVSIANGEAHARATVPSMGTIVDATIGIEDGALTATAEVTDADIVALARPTGPAGPAAEADSNVSATMSLRATVEGLLRDRASLALAVGLERADASVHGVAVRLARPAEIHLRSDALEVRDLDMRIGNATLTAGGRLGPGATDADALDMSLTGSMTDVMPFVHLREDLQDLSATGALAIRLRAAGAFDAPQLLAYVTLTDGSIGQGDLPPMTDLQLAASYTAGLFNVSTLSGRWQGAELAATGRIPVALLGDSLPELLRASAPPLDAAARADVHVLGLTPTALEPFVEPETLDQLAGRVDLVAYVEATAIDLGAVTADVTLTHAEAQIARLALAQTYPTQLRFANRRLDVVEWSWAGNGTSLDMAGYVRFDEEAPQLNVGASGGVDLRMLNALFRGVATTGHADFDVRALGPTTDPIIQGRIGVEDADLAIRNPRLAITELGGQLLLTPGHVEVNLAGNANGGTLAVAGGTSYENFSPTGGTITVTGRGMAFEPIEGLRTELDTDLAFGARDGGSILEGRVTLVRGDFRRQLSLTDLLTTRAEHVVMPDTGTPGMLERLQLNVAVESIEDIQLNNNFARAELGANLRVIGTAADPVVTGRATFREGGEVFLAGQTYRVRRGTVDFTNALRSEPSVDIVLEARVQRYDITLEVRGPLDQVEVDLRSPGLSQQDVLSLMLTGQLSQGTTMAYADVARGQLLILLSGEVLSAAGRSIGFDSVRVGRGFGGADSTFDLLSTASNPDTRLTISKNLTTNLELIFSQSLRNSGDITWIAVYRPGRRVELRTTTNDQNVQTFEFRHEVEFGRGTSTAAAARPATPRVMVAAVQITGAPGFPEAELRRVLRLQAGDVFDYFRWQQDRDRLLAFYHDRGYFEARLRARREDTDDGRVMLIYDVQRGARTTLTVEGHRLPSGVIRQLETEWSESVFVGFLVEDIEDIVRRELVADGYLQAAIDVTVDGASDQTAKTIHVAIEPGPRFADRQLVFEGNDELADSLLDSVVRARRMEDLVWQDPATVAAALQQYYRSLGYMRAEVTAGDLRFDGPSATQPMYITEGRAFTIGTVDVTGPVARAPGDVKETFSLQAGDAYRPAEVEPARRRVEVEYLQLGHNHVRVVAAVTLDEEQALAHVALTVDEGAQQILAGVDVTGADVTSRRTIDNALRLETGKPVDLSHFFAAQRRLYDTGVFQSVDVLAVPEGETPADATTEPVRASVVLREMPRYRLRYGFRATGSVEQFDVNRAADVRRVQPGIVADLLNRNVLGRAITTGVAGQLEFDRWLARGIVSLPSMLRLPVTTNLFITKSLERFESEPSDAALAYAYAEDALDLTLEQRFNPARSMTVIWGYSFTRQHTYELNVDPDSLFPPLDDRQDIARLSATYAWDTRDDPSNALRGWFHSSGLEYGSNWLGSDLRFVRYLAQQFYFRPTGSATLASAVRLGLGLGLGQELISSEKFFAGGGSTVRGFGENSLGEYDFFGPIGGNSLLVLNQEARFPIYRWVRGVAFIDAGNVFPTISDLRLRDLAVGTGFGLRITSPFAVIRVDYGMPLTDRANQPRGRWYFAFGQTF